MRLIATIEQRDVIDRMLRHLGLPADLPVPWPARAPPEPRNGFEAADDLPLPVYETCA
jgi:hypothetical protein